MQSTLFELVSRPWTAALTLALPVALAGCGESVPPPSDAPRRDAGRTVATDTGTPAPPLAMGSLRIADTEGDAWRVTGERTGGAGEDLRSVTGHNAFWFAWSVFHPGTSIFGRSEPIRDATIGGDGTCTVPCDQIIPACGGRDCIPSLQSPPMVSPGDAALSYLADADEVVGVMTPQGPRAYPQNILWWHEIINESVAGRDYAVTFCPLTGSALLFDRASFVDGEVVELGVSGNLYNSNLTMYDRTTESFWNQMRAEAVFGPELGAPAPVLPVFEMTWRAWRALHPDTQVVSSATGHTRDYTRYPYGDYRTDGADTFRRTDPPPDPAFDGKAMTFGLFAGGEVRAYVWDVLQETVGARQGLLEDELGGVPVALVFDLDERYVHAFDRRVGGVPRTLTLQRASP